MAFTIPSWPTVTDDDGSLTFGTPFDAAYNSAVEAALAAKLYDAGVALWPVDVASEVKTARGSKSTLDGRLSVSLNPDGTLITPASLASVANLQSILGNPNLIWNGDLDFWSAGASAAPNGFVLAGAGGTIARCGSGEADTTSFGTGQYTAKVTRSGTNLTLTWTIVDAADISKYTQIQGKKFTAFMRAKTGVTNYVRIVVNDGATQTESSYAPGTDTETGLSVLHTISGSATKLEVQVQFNSSNGDAYVGGFMAAFSEIEFADWAPFTSPVDATATRRGLIGLDDQALGAGQKTLGTKVPLFNPGTSEIATVATVLGVLEVNTTQVANVGGGPDNLMTYAIPADVLDADGAFIHVKAWGVFANNGNNKEINLKLGSTTIFDHTTATFAGTSWMLDAYIVRTGVGAQDVAAFLSAFVQNGTAIGAVIGSGNGSGTCSEDETSSLTLAVVAQTCTANDDIVQHGMVVSVGAKA